MSEFANLGSDPLLVHNPYHDVMDNYYNYNNLNYKLSIIR